MSKIVEGIAKDLKSIPEKFKAKTGNVDKKKLLLMNLPYVLMFGNVKLIGEERSYPSKLHDALPSVQDCNLILAHKLFSGLLVIKPVGLRRTPCVRGIVKVNRFFTQNFRHLF